MDKNILKRAIINALGTFIYVTAVGLFMSNASKVFGEQDTAFTPVAVLMLLVFSAAFTGMLVVGTPALWYVDGRKKPALLLAGYTMAGLLCLTVLAFLLLFLFR